MVSPAEAQSNGWQPGPGGILDNTYAGFVDIPQSGATVPGSGSFTVGGWFVDGIGQEGYEKVKAMYEGSAPLERACTPEDVAEAVVWLVHGARTVTGELLLLDAGMHLGARQAGAIASGKA